MFVLGLLAFWPVFQAHSQELAIKSNIFGDALLSPNLGVEFAVSSQWTLDFIAHYQPFTTSENHRFKHWFIQPEARRWLCTTFAGHFFGAHLLGGRYNIGNVHLPFGLFKGIRDYRYEGWAVGAGLSYGYHWVLSSRWSVEASLGLGIVYMGYDRFNCGHCGKKLQYNGHKTYLGPTKASISLIYMIK